MKGSFLVSSRKAFVEPNIYADKSSLVLEWLLFNGIEKELFSIREVVSDTGVSLGQVQKIFRTLTMNGCLQAEGLRTAKKFILKRPQILLKNWLEHYSIVKKCKMHTYRSGLQGHQQLLDVLNKSHLKEKIVLALHSAAEMLGFKNTNLETLELYIPDTECRLELEEILQLEPQERGYEVLLIEPYYKSMIVQSKVIPSLRSQNNVFCSSPLLTFLDLYHFPLRGLEQAEFMAERMIELKRIYKKP